MDYLSSSLKTDESTSSGNNNNNAHNKMPEQAKDVILDPFCHYNTSFASMPNNNFVNVSLLFIYRLIKAEGSSNEK